MSVPRHDLLPLVVCMTWVSGHETPVCNIILCWLLWVFNKCLSHRVMLWCHVVSTHIVHIVCMLWNALYVWDSTPSCVPLVVLFTGKCLFVLLSSLGSLLLLGTHWLTGMYPSLLLCLSPRGNVTRCNGVLVACYDSSTHADDRHLLCWVMYACPCTDVPLGFITSHVDPGSLSFEC